MKVSDGVIDALRNETPIPNELLEAVRSFNLTVVLNRDEVADADLESLYFASYE